MAATIVRNGRRGIPYHYGIEGWPPKAAQKLPYGIKKVNLNRFFHERENIPITFRTRPYSRRPNKKPRTNNRRHPSKEPPHSSREQRQLSNSFHRFFSSVFFAENSEVWKMINIFHIPQAIRKGHKTESFFLHLMRRGSLWREEEKKPSSSSSNGKLGGNCNDLKKAEKKRLCTTIFSHHPTGHSDQAFGLGGLIIVLHYCWGGLGYSSDNFPYPYVSMHSRKRQKTINFYHILLIPKNEQREQMSVFPQQQKKKWIW